MIESCDRQEASIPGYTSPSGTFVECNKEEIEQSIPQRFEKIVQEFPDRLAIKMGDRALTYDDLNQAANRIARAILAKRGEGSEPIALLFEHGIDAIAAIFGVLKAGKFYVALDCSIPRERICYILQDSQASLILTNSRNLGLARTLTTDTPGLVNIDEIEGSHFSSNIDYVGTPDDVAALTYTSGSTGKPKGVVQNHRFLLHKGVTYVNELPTFLYDRFTLLHSVTFSSASVNLFRALLNGSALFPFDLKSEGIIRLVSWLEEEQITICHLPPPAFRQLAESLTDGRNLPQLRAVVLSGSPISQLDFDLYKKHFPQGTLFAFHMGTTETGIVGSAAVNHSFAFPTEGFPVGYLTPDIKVGILHGSGHQVGPGQVGEIAVQGRGLAMGYWRQPELDKVKFLPDPSGGDERIYLTGDLGRMMPDGFLIHMGRKDSMVKIRGYRVEIGEIEKALLAHPQVQEASVAAWDREPSEKYLVAYIVSRDKPAPTINQLRDFLKEKLSDYMIPSAFVFLQSLPLINGKLDRRALPKPSNERPDLDQAFTSPRYDVEQKLANIWTEVLGVNRVGIHDDFFDLGGHSLLAAQLFVRIDRAFGKQFPAATITSARTIEQLADIVRQEVKPSPCSLLVPIQPNGTKRPFFWACGYTSDVFLPRYLGKDQPLYGLLNQCHDGKRSVYNRLEDIAAHHLREIRSVQSEGPYYLGGFCFGGMVAFEMAQQLKRQGQEVALLFLVDLATIKNCKFLVDRLLASGQLLAEMESFRDEVSRHLRELFTLGYREKLAYVRVRVADRINQVIAGANNVVKKLIRTGCFITGHSIPPSLRLDYIVTVDSRVLRDYDPPLYPGSIVHIKAQASAYDPQFVANLTAGGLETYEIACRHSDLISESHIHVWAKQLMSYLSETQAKSMIRHHETRLERDRPVVATNQ